MSSGTFKPTANGDTALRTGSDEWYAGSFGFGKFGAAYLHSCARIPNVTIPQGATITSAFMRNIARLTRTGTTCNARIYFNDTDDAVAPTGLVSFDSLVKTTAYADWDAIAAWTAGQTYDSPDFSAVLQEVVDRAGWVSGNAAMLIINDNVSSNGAERYGYGYLEDPLQVVEIHATWNPGGGPANLKTYMTVPIANIGKINGKAIADVGKLNNVA